MESILQQSRRCLVCGITAVECHHVFGASNRKLSEKYGLTVWLCHKHHNEPPEGVHFNREFADDLKEWAQMEFEKYYQLDFVKLFGKNYRSDHED
jgi:hypothetical protein